MGALRFWRVKAPGRAEPKALVRRIAERVAGALERMGLVVRDAASAWRKALVLGTITPIASEDRASERVAKAD